MKILRYIRHMDEAAYNAFENLTVYSKSLIMGGLLGSALVAICSVIAVIYIMCNGYTMELGDIVNSFIDRSAALPAISVVFCFVCEIYSKNIK